VGHDKVDPWGGWGVDDLLINKDNVRAVIRVVTEWHKHG